MPGLAMPLGGTPVQTYALEDALHAWVVAGSGLPANMVRWADQKDTRPDRASGSSTFATLKIDSVVSLGAVDALESYYDALRPAGQEIEKRVVGQRSLTCRVQFFGAPTTDALGTPSAVELARRTRTALRLPSVRGALTDAGLSPHDVGQVQNLGALLGSDFDGRASFDASFYFVETASEYIGYIASANVTDEQTGDVIAIEG